MEEEPPWDPFWAVVSVAAELLAPLLVVELESELEPPQATKSAATRTAAMKATIGHVPTLVTGSSVFDRERQLSRLEESESTLQASPSLLSGIA